MRLYKTLFNKTLLSRFEAHKATLALTGEIGDIRSIT